VKAPSPLRTGSDQSIPFGGTACDRQY
jgi:hypothetical protein